MEIYRRSSIAFVVGVLLLLGAYPLLATDIEGKILVSSPFPEQKLNKVEKDREHCGELQVSQSLLISSQGGLKNAVVYLEGDFETAEAPIQSAPVLLDQKNCRFEPHVLLVPANQIFKIGNGDPVAHDVRIFDGADMLYRFEMDEYQKPTDQKLDKTGKFVIRCGLHKWMHAYVVSMDHPYYAITREDGSFNLRNIPAGNYTMHIWHESLGEEARPIQISDSMQGFTYTFPSPLQKT